MRTWFSIRAQYGAVVDSGTNHVRVADIQVRLGDPALDNTHGSHRRLGGQQPGVAAGG